MSKRMRNSALGIFTTVLCAIGIVSIHGCVSYEETSPDIRDAKPTVQEINAVDTTRQITEQKVEEQVQEQPVVSESKVAPTFKSIEDTVQASIIMTSKPTAIAEVEMEETEPHSVYTVQIGAYGSASNALRRQKRAKEQFPGQPVFNQYDEARGLYRVSIGMYDNSEDAQALVDSLKLKYPKEYKQCLINFIP